MGGVQQREFDIQRRIQIAYLDDTLRVARFLPSEELADDEAGEQRSEEEIIFVFKRVVEEEEEEEAVQVGAALLEPCSDGARAVTPAHVLRCRVSGVRTQQSVPCQLGERKPAVAECMLMCWY